MSTKKSIALVTGANRGIGFETAKGLAEKGIHVVLGSRDKKAGDVAARELVAKGFSAEAIQLDVNNVADQKAAAKYLGDKYGKLDILVNNAGVLDKAEGSAGEAVNRTSTLSLEILQQTFATNFFSVVGLTQTLLPLIRKSSAGRIVNLSSILGSLALHADPDSPIYGSKYLAYDTSKTALNSFTVHLAHELKDTPIKVNSAHPGWVKTDMGTSAAPMEIADGAKTSIELALLTPDGPTGGFFHLGERLPW